MQRQQRKNMRGITSRQSRNKSRIVVGLDEDMGSSVEIGGLRIRWELNDWGSEPTEGAEVRATMMRRNQPRDCHTIQHSTYLASFMEFLSSSS